MERPARIELASSAWKAVALPLSYGGKWRLGMATKKEIKDFLAEYDYTPVTQKEIEATPDEDLMLSLTEIQKIGFTATMILNEISDGRLRIYGPPVSLDQLPLAEGSKMPFDCMFVTAENMEEWLVNPNVPAWIRDAVMAKMAES